MKKYLLIALLAFSPFTFAEFDRTDPADLLALKSEVANDPIAMGYVLTGSTPKILSQLNTGSLNVGGETTGEAFTAGLLLEVIDSDDITIGNKFSEGNARWLDYLMSSASANQNFAFFEARVRAIFDFNPTPQTIINLDAATRLISRAEVLFGVDVTISKADWLAARDS